MESRWALRDLVSNYCHGVDKHDIDLFMSIWHDDAVWKIGPPFGDFYGAADIRHALVDVIWPAWRETHHWTTNLTVSFDGPDSARGVCDVNCNGATPDDVMQVVVGDLHRPLRAACRDAGRSPNATSRSTTSARCRASTWPRRRDERRARRRVASDSGTTSATREQWRVPFEPLYRGVLDQIADRRGARHRLGVAHRAPLLRRRLHPLTARDRRRRSPSARAGCASART